MGDLDWEETPNTKPMILKPLSSFSLIFTIYIC